MAFIHFSPLGKNSPILIHTSNSLTRQVWQELTTLRFENRRKIILAPKAIAPWVDQAKMYFLDATQSNWRSAGLLYYYSFLNLAKAYLVAKRTVSYKTLDTTSIYHGLQAGLQPLNYITDFEITIFPPTYQGRKNIFSMLYETIFAKQWPFDNPISVSLADIVGHCVDVSIELETLFNIKNRIIRTQSLIRFENNETWFEMAVEKANPEIVIQQIENMQLDIVKLDELTSTSRNDWRRALNVTAEILPQMIFLRGPKKSINQNDDKDLNLKATALALETTINFEVHSIPHVAVDTINKTWLFIPNVSISGKSFLWHPVLSDYLFAFALSSILRYQPQFLDPTSRNYLFSEAWCSQSALSTARYFLMLFTEPPIAIKTY
ncbi:YaaC family protein [Thermodesulfobacteriota bacterium]